jgi:cellulose synthase/poly-beta-1,6-N-acetylglucosamine synthase-like glycosyltransferase
VFRPLRRCSLIETYYSARRAPPAKAAPLWGDIALERSVSVLLPVHNAQNTLARNVATVLDVLPELTDQFEVLIIDDGSTDGTEEVARELSREFPQVRVARHDARRGLAEALHTGLERTDSEIVFLRDTVDSMEHEVHGDGMAQLWRLRDDQDIAIARKKNSQFGIQMIRREALEKTALRPTEAFLKTPQPVCAVDVETRDTCFAEMNDFLV